MAVICQGCGQSFPVPAGYGRNKIQCPGCGVICQVPTASSHPAAPAPAARPAPPGPSPSPFDEAYPAVEVEEPPSRPRPPAPQREVQVPCRRCGAMVRRQRECPTCDAEADKPIPVEPAARAISLELDDPPAPPPAEEDDGPYELSEPLGPSCPKCRREMKRGAVVCLACGFNVRTRKKVGRAYEPITRAWDSDMSLASRLGWLAAGQCFHVVLAFLAFPATGTFVPFIITWPLLTLLLLFLLGTYDRVELTRDTRGRVTLTIRWRALFVPLTPEVIDVRGFEGVVSGPWQQVGFLEWLVLFTLLPWGIVPGALWYYYAMHLQQFHAALAQDHGQPTVYIYRGRNQEQMNEIANAVCAAASIRRLG